MVRIFFFSTMSMNWFVSSRECYHIHYVRWKSVVVKHYVSSNSGRILFEYFHLIELQVPQGAKNMSEIIEYVRFVFVFIHFETSSIYFVSSEMNVIDNQRILNQFSNKLEPRQSWIFFQYKQNKLDDNQHVNAHL